MNHRTLILVNLLLAGIVCLLGLKVYNVWNEPYALPKTGVKEVVVKPDRPRPQTQTRVRKPNDNYDIIVEKNLFSESRSKGTESAVPPSEMVLHGCFIFGERKVAVLEAQEQEKKNVSRGRATKVSRNKESREVTVGDRIAEYQVANILEDKIVLKDNAGKTCIVQIEIPRQRSHVRTEVSKARTTRVSKRKTSRKTAAKSPPRRK